MNTELDYDAIVKSISPIVGFKQMVQSESRRPLAIKTLVHYLGLTEKEAKAFVDEYYNRMDINLKTTKITNGMAIKASFKK